jgi:PAS domain S-box-containing protein
MKTVKRLRNLQFYARSLIEANIDAMLTTDARGIITDVNKQTEAITGCRRDELIGAPFKNLFTDSRLAEAGINCVLTEGKVTNYELTARSREGRQTVVSCNATTFYDRDRGLQGVFATARDMTEPKRYQETLRQKNLELEEASRIKSEFIANMSHELRTPLNAVIGFSEVLTDGLLGKLSDSQRDVIVDILSSGVYLLSLINDILDLSKVESGKMTLDLESVPASTLFADSLTIVKEKAASRHIRLVLDVAEDMAVIEVDVRMVKQIVYNLLSNAVKFAAEGGEVALHAGRVPRAAASGSPQRGSNASSSRSLRSTAVRHENLRARDLVWRWSSSLPSYTAGWWRWRAPWARAPASRSGCRSGFPRKRL